MVDYVDVEDDDDLYEGLFEDGHWEWNDNEGCLKFFSDATSTVESETNRQMPVVIGPIEFRDDLDILEQQRFRKRYQRKYLPEDVVILQDIKDLVLFTAPKSIITAALVNVLHLSMTERFIRALITYCQYFLQVSVEMSRRTLELHSKIRTKKTDAIEVVYRDNLEDLRLLLAKQYCSIIVGAGNFAKYHHMGALKKSLTSTKKERILFESILRISTQIVWLALGRRKYNQIEMEIHRLFKTDIYNIIAHKMDYNYRDDLDERELFVLFGDCLKPPRKLTAHSPIMYAVECHRDVDYRIMGLGVIHYNSLSPRLRFFERVLIAPEEVLEKHNVSIGILGMPRSRFDTTLREVKMPVTSTSGSTSTAATRRSSQSKSVSRLSRASTCSGKSTQVQLPLYKDICIPDKEDVTECLPDCFPESDLRRKPCSESQRKKWIVHASHLYKFQLLHKKRSKL